MRIYTPSIHSLNREQWTMMMEGLRSMEPLPIKHGTKEEQEAFSQRHADWRIAMRSLEAICPAPRR